MRIPKLITVAASAIALTLGVTACSSEPEQTPEEIMISEMESALMPPEGVTVDSEMPDVAEGDVIPITCYTHNPCDGTLTLESVTLSDKCAQRVDDYGMGPELEEGKTYLQIAGIFELKSANNGWTMLHDPQILNAEGFTEDVGMAINCHEDDEYRSWSATLDQGQKAKYFRAWIVPEGATHALMEDVKISLPEVDQESEIILPDAFGNMPTTTPSVSPESSEELYTPETSSSQSIFNDPGVGYQCPGTDAFVDNPAHCTPENLGADPATIPFANGGTCPAYKCGYGTDAEGNDLNQEKADSHAWWGECIAANTAEYCRANDPWQQ